MSEDNLIPVGEKLPLLISLEVQSQLSAELKCMDLFEQLMVSRFFENIDSLEGCESMLIWMRSVIDRKIIKLGESK